MRFRSLLVFPFLTALCLAGEYAQADREKAVALLQESRRSVSVALENMSAKQSTFKPENNGWSATEVVEHLVLIEDFLLGFLKQALEKPQSIPDTEKLPDFSEADRNIVAGVSDRTQKAKAPEQALPKGTYSNWDDAFAAFSLKRQATVEFVEKSKQDLRRFMIETPNGKLDCHQWLLLIAAHTERHVKQIAELKGLDYFPKE